jgi:uncharacterized protein
MEGGERDLGILLASLAPRLDPLAYVMATLPAGLPLGLKPLATFAEDEGLSVIVRDDVPLPRGAIVSSRLARLTMMVHSSLDAVGMTAAMAAALTAHGISANVVAAYYHDHIFVPWDRRHDAVAAIEALALRSRQQR